MIVHPKQAPHTTYTFCPKNLDLANQLYNLKIALWSLGLR